MKKYNLNNFNNLNKNKFIRNRIKRKSHDFGNTSKSSQNHLTAIIVSSVLCSIFLIFTLFLLFVPSFRTLAIDHVLMSISSGGNHKDISNADNSISDGIKHVIINADGEKLKLSNDVYTFLATATDHSESLTDVIMIAKFDSGSRLIDVLQIPRDTYVKLSGHLIIDDKGNISPDNFNSSGYETKVNALYSAGKNLSKTPINNLLKAAKNKSYSEIVSLCKSKEYSYLGISPDTVSNYVNESDSTERKELVEAMYKSFGIRFLSTFVYYSYGIPIDYYAQVNIKGFRNIVDAIGGVDLYVPQNMYHNDPTQDLYINLKQGYQHLDGKKAEQFVRFRSYTFGDIDRLDAQKNFISAFLSKLSKSSISQLQQITNEVLDNLYTNLTLSETANFARQLLSMDLSKGFTMTTLPGSPVDVTRNGVWVSYYSANKSAVMELVNNKFNKYNRNLPDSHFGILSLSNSAPVFGTTVVGTESDSEASSATTVAPATSNNTVQPSTETESSAQVTVKTEQTEEVNPESQESADNVQEQETSTSEVTDNSNGSSGTPASEDTQLNEEQQLEKNDSQESSVSDNDNDQPFDDLQELTDHDSTNDDSDNNVVETPVISEDISEDNTKHSESEIEAKTEAALESTVPEAIPTDESTD